uniref:C-X-C motif chemokine n=1 Tax=Callithrix jacchus TaxID=9483 RepID=A0A8I4A249_CALJA
MPKMNTVLTFPAVPFSFPTGLPHSRTVRCNCISISKHVNPRFIETLEIIPASQSCSRVEIIATMKNNGEKRCLNLESKAIKNLLTAVSKLR